MADARHHVMETPIYRLTEAARYLHVPLNVAPWAQGSRSVPPLIRLPGLQRLAEKKIS